MDAVADVTGCEERLRAAMLCGDVESLASLIDERLVFTGPDGTVLTKAQDLSAHETGTLRLTRLDLGAIGLHHVGDMILVTRTASLAGWFGDTPIDGTYAYTRLWSWSSGCWRVVAGHAGRIG